MNIYKKEMRNLALELILLTLVSSVSLAALMIFV